MLHASLPSNGPCPCALLLQVQELRKRSDNLPDDYLVVFVGEQQQNRPLLLTFDVACRSPGVLLQLNAGRS